ncbi:TetR/AcrR family transcriptional regulator [Pseudomonas sp. GB2N2]
MTTEKMVFPIATPARNAGRPTRAAAADLRRRILEAALQGFIEKGFEGATIDGIARAANTHRDTIYRQFSSKEQLYRETLLAGMDQHREDIRVALSIGGSPEVILRHCLHQLYRSLMTPISLAIIRLSITEASRFPDLTEAALQDSQQNLAALANYLGQLNEQGVLTLEDAQESAMMLATCAHGGFRLVLEKPMAGEVLDTWLERVLKLFLRGWNYQPERLSC